VRRIGQTKPTTILTYVATDTVDDRVCRIRMMRGHAACTGEQIPTTDGNEHIPHRVRFCMLLGVPTGDEAPPAAAGAVGARPPVPNWLADDDDDDDDANGAGFW
jgi:hypothetical protein